MPRAISEVKQGKILEALLLDKNGTDFLKKLLTINCVSQLSIHNLISFSRIFASYWHLGVCKMYANVHLDICMYVWRCMSICHHIYENSQSSSRTHRYGWTGWKMIMWEFTCVPPSLVL